MVNRTPIMRRFQVNQNGKGAASDPPRQMQVMGMTFNRPNFSGATANQAQQNNMLKQINEIKKKNPNLPSSNLPSIPAWKGKAPEPETANVVLPQAAAPGEGSGEVRVEEQKGEGSPIIKLVMG